MILTPIEEHDGFYFKRDDLHQVAGVRGGKVRTCLYLAEKYSMKGIRGLVTASARTSPQALIVASIANHLDLKARLHMPSGQHTPEMIQTERLGAEIVQHKAGYNTVIISRAEEDAKALGYGLIPFGMQCREAVTQTQLQVQNIPEEVKQIVVCVGSGMSLAGILQGLVKYGRERIRIKAIVVGADPMKRLERYTTFGWHRRVQFFESKYKYNEPAEVTIFKDIELDPYYEAKCIPYIEKGNLFWVVGIRGIFDENTKNDPSGNTEEGVTGTVR